jgi:peptidylprolyl isomerase
MTLRNRFVLFAAIITSCASYGFGHEEKSAAIFAQALSQKTTKEQSTSKVDMAKVSETFGNFFGRTISNPALGIQLDIDYVVRGIKEGAAGRSAPLSEEEYEKAIAVLQEQAFNKLADDNLKSAEKFLKEVNSKKGITVIEPAKLSYEILQEGSGDAVKENSTPLINYSGKFIDGSVFGTSDDTGPISISIENTIPGFTKGLLGMKQGEKRRLYIHPELGYGTRGELPPNSLLIFDVEVLKTDSPAHAYSDSSEDEDNEENEDKDTDQKKATPKS